MDAKDALKVALASELAPYLRSQGFKGSGRTFTLNGERLDKAIVNIQGSSWSSADKQVFYVNLSLVPRPWALFSMGGTGRNVDRPTEADGLFRLRLDPEGARAQQWVVENPRDAVNVVRNVVERLEQPDGVPLLKTLMDRSRFIAQVHSGDLGNIKRTFGYDRYLDWALAIMLCDDGPSAQLDEVVQRLESTAGGPATDRHDAVIAWVKQRANES